jgi:hypothetical protein
MEVGAAVEEADVEEAAVEEADVVAAPLWDRLDLSQEAVSQKDVTLKRYQAEEATVMKSVRKWPVYTPRVPFIS